MPGILPPYYLNYFDDDDNNQKGHKKKHKRDSAEAASSSKMIGSKAGKSMKKMRENHKEAPENAMDNLNQYYCGSGSIGEILKASEGQGSFTKQEKNELCQIIL